MGEGHISEALECRRSGNASEAREGRVGGPTLEAAPPRTPGVGRMHRGDEFIFHLSKFLSTTSEKRRCDDPSAASGGRNARIGPTFHDPVGFGS